jgi:F0F1-type ATP synthase membrane subunit b/b'
MKMLSSNETLARSLAEEVRKEVESECREVLEAAKREAEEIVAHAFTSARARGHEAIAAMRQEGRRRLMRAEARRQTREQMLNDTRAAEALRRALPLLEPAILQRWGNKAGRRLWLEAVARHARARLLPGDWAVEHPLDFASEDRDRLLASLKCAGGDNIVFGAAPGVKAGVRVRAEGAVLDGTSDALLADQSALKSLLLAELSYGASRAFGSTGGTA